jgi:CRISPR-associated protein Cmr5
MPKNRNRPPDQQRTRPATPVSGNPASTNPVASNPAPATSGLSIPVRTQSAEASPPTAGAPEESGSKNRTSLDQKRGAYAWGCIAAMQSNCSDKTKYINLAKSAPALVMSNGLMQTLAFLESKCPKETDKKIKDPHYLLGQHVCEWLGKTLKTVRCGEAGDFPDEAKANYKSVMPCLFQGPSQVYRRATEETFALLRWIKQFAAAVDKAGTPS